MNWDQLEGKWKQAKGSAREKWGKFTDDDLDRINGQKERLIGSIQERYGLMREEAEEQAQIWWTDFERTHSPRAMAHHK